MTATFRNTRRPKGVKGPRT